MVLSLVLEVLVVRQSGVLGCVVWYDRGAWLGGQVPWWTQVGKVRGRLVGSLWVVALADEVGG